MSDSIGPDEFLTLLSLKIPRPRFQLSQQPAAIRQPSGDQAHHSAVALDRAAGGQHARVQHQPALALHHLRSYQQVNLTALVFEEDEDHAAGGGRAMADAGSNWAFGGDSESFC